DALKRGAPRGRRHYVAGVRDEPRGVRSACRSEQIVHPRLKMSRIIAQPPFDENAAVVVLPYLPSGVQLVLETGWPRESERPVTDLSFVTVALLGKRSVVAEKDDAKPPDVSVIEPIVNAFLRRLVAEDRFVGLYQEIAALEPVKLFDAGDRYCGPENAGSC